VSHNPYAPPKTEVGGGVLPPPPTERRRPVMVWVIGIYYLFSCAFSMLSLYLVWSGKFTLNPAQAAYLGKLSLLDHAVTIGLEMCAIAGAIALLALRKVAPVLLTINLGVSTATTVWHIATKGWAGAIGGAGLVGTAVGIGILVAVCVYTWGLRRNGTLR
jgi:hypothetical protein